MKKIITLLLVALCAIGGAKAQVPVTDPVFIMTYSIQSGEQNRRLQGIENTTQRINAMQVSVNAQLAGIQNLQRTTYNYLRQAQGLVRNMGQIQQAYRLFDDIIVHLGEITTLAAGNPALITIARDVQRDVSGRTLNLISYITGFVLANNGENMLDSKQRVAFLNDVIHEMRVMRGLVFAIKRQMQWAQRDGHNWSAAILGNTQRQIAERRQIADDVIRDIRRLRLN